MHFTIEQEREEDGRWLAEVPELPGVLAYGATEKEAMEKAQALALRVLAERLELSQLSTGLDGRSSANPDPTKLSLGHLTPNEFAMQGRETASETVKL